MGQECDPSTSRFPWLKVYYEAAVQLLVAPVVSSSGSMGMDGGERFASKIIHVAVDRTQSIDFQVHSCGC